MMQQNNIQPPPHGPSVAPPPANGYAAPPPAPPPVPPPPPQSQPPYQQMPQGQPPLAQPPGQQQPPVKKKHTFLWFCLGCLGLLVVFAILILFFGRYIVKNVLGPQFQKALEDAGVKFEETVQNSTDTGGTGSNNDTSKEPTKKRLPDNFPNDIPAYPGSTVLQTLQSDSGQSSVILQSADSFEKVEEYYRTQMKKKGWKELSTLTPSDSGAYYSFTKEGREAIIVVAKNDSNHTTGITISYGKR